MGLRDAVLLSVRPRYARLLFDGTKTVELRRVPPTVTRGTLVLIYESAPTMALVGAAVVRAIEVGAPKHLWPCVRDAAGVSRAEYDDYFEGAERAAALHLRSVKRFADPVRLDEIRRRWRWLRPPQSYRYLKARVSAGAVQLSRR